MSVPLGQNLKKEEEQREHGFSYGLFSIFPSMNAFDTQGIICITFEGGEAAQKIAMWEILRTYIYIFRFSKMLIYTIF